MNKRKRKPSFKKHPRRPRPFASSAADVKNKLNRYICQKCGGAIITIEIHKGHAPALIVCKAKTDCGGVMTSGFYKVPCGLDPSFEFYRPNFKHVAGDAIRAYLETGGLLIRPVAAVPDQKHFPPTVAMRGNVTADDVRQIAGKYAAEK